MGVNMKEYIITIDTGTSNTRTILWDMNRNKISEKKQAVGVRNTAIDGNNDKLKAAVKGCLDKLIEEADISYDNIKRVIASGMITSNVGLVEIPHITAPADVDDLAAATTDVILTDVCPLPIWFIPGIKNSNGEISLQNYEAMDIMRGEEVESIAIIEDFPKGKNMLLILPGSHSKFVAVDSEGKITGCLTTISGELLASITNDTIIADAVGRSFVEEDTYDKEFVILGYETAKKTGIGRACFSARILNQFYTKDKTKLANFVLGISLQNDFVAIQNSDAVRVDKNTTVIVAGKNPLRRAILDILSHINLFAEVKEYVPKDNTQLSALGAYIIAKKCNIL